MSDSLQHELTQTTNIYGEPIVRFAFPEDQQSPQTKRDAQEDLADNFPDREHSFASERTVRRESITEQNHSSSSLPLVYESFPPQKSVSPPKNVLSLVPPDILTIPDTPIHSPALRAVISQLQTFLQNRPEDTVTYSTDLVQHYKDGIHLKEELVALRHTKGL